MDNAQRILLAVEAGLLVWVGAIPALELDKAIAIPVTVVTSVAIAVVGTYLRPAQEALTRALGGKPDASRNP